jgi:hypothetical protein
MTINAKIGIAYASSPPLPLLGRPARTAIVGGGTRGTLRHETQWEVDLVARHRE